MIFRTKRDTEPHPDPRLGNLCIKITCPLCGVSRVGDADEVLKWQTEHLCRHAEKETAA